MREFLTSLPWFWIGIFAVAVVVIFLVLSFLLRRKSEPAREEYRPPERERSYAAGSNVTDPRVQNLDGRVLSLERKMQRVLEHLEAEAQKARSQPPLEAAGNGAFGDPGRNAGSGIERSAEEPYRGFVDRPEISDEAAVAALREDTSVRTLIESFNRMAERDDRAGLQTFAQQHGVFHLAAVGVAQDAEVAEEGSLWAVEVDSETHLVVIPSAAVVQGWQKFYRDLSGLKARTELGPTFEVQEGPALRVLSPAWARRTGERTFRLVSRGAIEGI